MSDNEITLFGRFWPSLWYIDQGGNVHLDLAVTFTGDIPNNYDYQIDFKDYAGNITKSWSGTKSTGGQAETQLNIAWDGRNAGAKIPYKPFRFYATITDNEYSRSVTDGFCSGVHPIPPDPPDGPSDDDVCMFSGAFTSFVNDISIPDMGMPITVGRFFHSLGTFTHYSMYYGDCMFNYDEFLLHDESDNSYTVVCPDRKEFRFIKNGDIYTPSVNYNYHKLENGTEGTFVLTLKDGWKHYYDNYGRLIKIQNRTGQSIQYERGSTFTSPISRIMGPSGRSLTFSQENVIDDNNKDIVITDWIGRKWRYVIKDGYISQFIDPGENIIQYQELGAEFAGVQEVERANGVVITNEGFGGSPLGVRVKKQTPGVGAEFNYDYDWDNCQTAVNRGDREWKYYFDKDTGLLEKKVDPAGYEWTYTYDEYRNMTGETDPEGNTTAYTYDNKGNMTLKTDPLGRTTTFEYNGYGQKTKEIGPPPYNRTTEWEYDSDTGNLLSITMPNNKKNDYEYYNSGLLKKVTSSGKTLIQYEYDVYGHKIKETDNLGRATEYKYDLTGSVTEEKNPDGEKIYYEYNLCKDMTKLIDTNGNATEFEYDGNRNVNKTILPDGTIGTNMFNAMGDITTSIDCKGRETTYDYDQFRQLTKITDPDGVVVQYEYDKLGRKIKETDRTGKVTQYGFETFSTRSEMDNLGRTTTYEYDASGRLIKVIYNDGSYLQYIYDQYRTTIIQPGERYGEIHYGGNGYNTKSYGSENYGGSGAKYGFDPGNKIELIYDEDNGSLKFVKYPRNKTISYQYDEDGFLSVVNDIRGYSTQYEYNEDDRIEKVTYRGMETNCAYDSLLRLLTVTLPNGIVKTMTYENETGNTLNQIKYEKDSEVLYQVDFEYDDEGKLQTKRVSGDSFIENTYRYLYDSESRVVGVYAGGKMDRSYQYDAAGNIVERRDASGDITDYSYDISDNVIRAGGTKYKYDANGNISQKLEVLRKNPAQYIYDNQNNLAMKVTPRGYAPPIDGIPDVNPLGLYTSRYRYYPDNRLSKKISPSGRELRFYYNYLYGNLFLLNEEGWNARTADSDDGYKLPTGDMADRITHIVSFFYGAESSPIGIDTTPAHCGPNEKCINYYLTDESNSIIALTDSMGNMIKTYKYDDRGNRIEVSSESPDNPHTVYNPMGFGGEYVSGFSSLKMEVTSESTRSNDQDALKKCVENFMKKIRGPGKPYPNKDVDYWCFDHAYIFGGDVRPFSKYLESNGFKIEVKAIYGMPDPIISGGTHYGVYLAVRNMSSKKITHIYTDFNHPFRNPRNLCFQASGLATEISKTITLLKAKTDPSYENWCKSQTKNEYFKWADDYLKNSQSAPIKC